MNNSLRIRLIQLLLAMWALILSPHAYGADTGLQARPGSVAIFVSDEEKAYIEPVATFSKDIGLPVEVFNLKGNIDNASGFMFEILSKKPSLIFALGAKAASIAKFWTADRPDVPVVFAMVLNWQRYNLLLGQENIAGISSDVAPGTQFANMTMFFPRMSRIGVIYSEEHSARIIEKARKAAGLLGLELIALPIQKPRDFQRNYREIAGHIDSYWILTDPVVYTMENMSWLEDRCIKDGLVCIGQSKNIAKLGVLLAVDTDIPNIGSQAASLAKSILFHKRRPKDIGVVPPLGTRIFLNMKTAGKIGINIDPSTMDFASEIINK